MKSICFSLFLFAASTLLGSEIQTISKSNGVLSPEDLNSFRQEFKLSSFIETGTYAGDTTLVASNIFEEVYSIDVCEPLYAKAKERFLNQANVHLYFGDTCDMLQQMIVDSPSKRLYWLDAHSSGGVTGGIPGFSPISHELKQIFEHEDNDFVILIDDLRGMCHCDKRTNLPLHSIISNIQEADADLKFYSIGDIGIIFNTKNHPSVVISDLVKSASISRFFDPSCKEEELLDQLISAESFISGIGKSTEEERNFRKLINFVNRNELGGEVIYLLWESLYKLGEMDYKAAIEDLRLVSKSFYSHWRVDAYLVKALILDGQIENASVLFKDKLSEISMQYPKIMYKILGDSYETLLELSRKNAF